MVSEAISVGSVGRIERRRSSRSVTGGSRTEEPTSRASLATWCVREWVCVCVECDIHIYYDTYDPTPKTDLAQLNLTGHSIGSEEVRHGDSLELQSIHIISSCCYL